MTGMTKGERQELGQLIRKREKVLKAQAAERSAALMAEFDAAMAKVYHYDDDPVWAQAQIEAEKAVQEAQTTIAARCAELGIPAEFAPGLSVYWHGRGQSAVASRRAELRRAAKSRVEAIEKEAITRIERLSLEAQTQVIASGLESDAAKTFLNAMPKMEELMPPVRIEEIQTLVETQRNKRGRLEWMQ